MTRIAETVVSVFDVTLPDGSVVRVNTRSDAEKLDDFVQQFHDQEARLQEEEDMRLANLDIQRELNIAPHEIEGFTVIRNPNTV